MPTFGFDLDGVISLLPFSKKQAKLTCRNEWFFWQFQKFKLLQKLYNFFLRRPNPEIKKVMNQLKERGFRVIIISASNEIYRVELERWLKTHGFHFDKLYLKFFPESCLDYKKRIVPFFCRCYLDDKKEIVDAINLDINNNGQCRAYLYQGQTKEEIFSFIPLFKVFETA